MVKGIAVAVGVAIASVSISFAAFASMEYSYHCAQDDHQYEEWSTDKAHVEELIAKHNHAHEGHHAELATRDAKH